MKTADEIRQEILQATAATGKADANISQMRLIEALIEHKISELIRTNKTHSTTRSYGSIELNEIVTDINRQDLIAFGFTVTTYGFMTEISW
jgi:hypothetical protein